MRSTRPAEHMRRNGKFHTNIRAQIDRLRRPWNPKLQRMSPNATVSP